MVTQMGYKLQAEQQQMISEDSLNRATRAKEQELEEVFKKQASQREMLSAVEQQLTKPLLVLIDQDQEARAKLQELRDDSQKYLPRVRAPKVLREYQRISAAPTGMTKVPPFDYARAIPTSKGECDIQSDADKESGDISFTIRTKNSQYGDASIYVEVGIQFSPITNGSLHIWANPGLNYAWQSNCNLLHSESYGWIGLHVESFDVAGGLVGSPVDQKISLWGNACHSFGPGPQNGSYAAYPLSANLPVDTDHNYILWVRAQAHIEADGSGLFGSNSSALAEMALTVPSITWELAG